MEKVMKKKENVETNQKPNKQICNPLMTIFLRCNLKEKKVT